MKKKLLPCLIIMSVTLLFPFHLNARESVALTIKADKRAFTLGEPIIIYVSLTNTGRTATEVMRILEPDGGFVEYWVKRPDGKDVAFLPWAHKDHPSPLQRLSPGEAVRAEAKIFFGGDGWTFTKPGRYEIRAVYLRKMNSNRLTVTVLSPADEATKRAADLFLRSDEVGKFLLFEGGDHLSDGIRRLEQAANQFPQTPHASYANFALGANLMQDFSNFKVNRLRRAEPHRAIKYLEKARAYPLTFHYTVNTHLSLIEGYKRVGDSRKAKTVSVDLERVISTKFRDFQPLLQDIRKRQSIELKSIHQSK
jgi:hypothetical protein